MRTIKNQEYRELHNYETIVISLLLLKKIKPPVFFFVFSKVISSISIVIEYILLRWRLFYPGQAFLVTALKEKSFIMKYTNLECGMQFIYFN